MLGAIEFLRYCVFRKKGTRKGQKLSTAGLYVSILGALLVVGWVIAYFIGWLK